MRRIAIGAACAGVGVLVVRAAAPKLHARLLAACERIWMVQRFSRHICSRRTARNFCKPGYGLPSKSWTNWCSESSG